MESLRGQLLIAGSGLLEPNFRRTVVLIGEHNEDGALGVVLNRPTDLAVDEAVPPLAGVAGGGATVFIGGPVRPTEVVLLAEFEETGHADLPVLGSIGFLVGEVEADVVTAIRRARVFAGYAGWGPGQLEQELEESAWILEPAMPADVFAEEPGNLWSAVLRRKGGEYRLLATMPLDPSLN